MSEITSAKPVICDRCGEAIDFRCFPAAIHVVGEKNFHIGCVTSKPDLRDDRIAELEKALGWFLSDDRFRVAVGGRPHVVEKMIADARTILEASEKK